MQANPKNPRPSAPPGAAPGSEPATDGTPRLKHGVQTLDGWLQGIERAAWTVRELVDAAAETRRTLSREVAEAAARARTKRDELASESERAARTGRMLAQLVSSYRWFGIRSAWLSQERTDTERARLHQENAERFTEASLEHGGALLKVGQLLSARRDLLPQVWTDSLAVLCDRVPPAPEAEARRALKAALSPEQHARFLEVSWPPVAAASIGQVHQARLAEADGERLVALKLRRPGIAGRVAIDLEMLELVAQALASSLPPMDHATIVREIRETVQRELDYHAEALAMERVAERLMQSSCGAPAGGVAVRVPRPVLELCSTSVLVSEWVDGEPLTVALDAARARGDQAFVSRVLERLLSVYVEQILIHGEFQADAHPGNFLVTPEGSLVLVDFGCMRALEPKVRRAFGRVFSQLVTGDAAAIADELAQMGFRTQSGRPDTLLVFAESMLGDLRSAMLGGGWPDPEQIGARARALLSQATSDPVIAIPAEFVMIGRVFASLGGLFLHYRPELDLARAVLPHLSQLALER